MVEIITNGTNPDKYPPTWDELAFDLKKLLSKKAEVSVKDEVYPGLLSDTLVKQEKKIKELEERIKAIEETTLKTVQAILNGTMDKTST
jgi:phosphopantetheine adenylyltransferase